MFTTQANLTHVNLTSIANEIDVKNFTRDSPQTIHMNPNSPAIDVKEFCLFTSISRTICH